MELFFIGLVLGMLLVLYFNASTTSQEVPTLTTEQQTLELQRIVLMAQANQQLQLVTTETANNQGTYYLGRQLEALRSDSPHMGSI